MCVSHACIFVCRCVCVRLCARVCMPSHVSIFDCSALNQTAARARFLFPPLFLPVFPLTLLVCLPLCVPPVSCLRADPTHLREWARRGSFLVHGQGPNIRAPNAAPVCFSTAAPSFPQWTRGMLLPLYLPQPPAWRGKSPSRGLAP